MNHFKKSRSTKDHDRRFACPSESRRSLGPSYGCLLCGVYLLSRALSAEGHSDRTRSGRAPPGCSLPQEPSTQPSRGLGELLNMPSKSRRSQWVTRA